MDTKPRKTRTGSRDPLKPVNRTLRRAAIRFGIATVSFAAALAYVIPRISEPSAGTTTLEGALKKGDIEGRTLAIRERATPVLPVTARERTAALEAFIEKRIKDLNLDAPLASAYREAFLSAFETDKDDEPMRRSHPIR